ncbi:MAG TPA: thioesterase family protein [Mycobacteriales bacterium]
MPRWPADRLAVDAYPGPGYDLPILYGDLDTNGHLNNVALGRFFEHARFSGNVSAGLREAGRPAGAHFLVARVAIDYLLEGRMGETLHVRTRLARIGTSAATLEQAAWQQGACLGLAEVVFVHLIDGRPAPISPAVRAVLESMRA